MAESIPENWANLAQYDLDTASAMLRSDRYLYVLFCCQQAAEKMLKAIIAERAGECPPRTHNLPELAKMVGEPLDEDQATLMDRLTDYYIKSRYSMEIPALSKNIGEQQASHFLRRTEEFVQWLSSKLPS